MNCLYCANTTSVTNSRTRNLSVWRRRSCSNDHTFTSYETADYTQIDVRKRDGGLEPFQTSKILLSLAKTGVSHDAAVNLQSTIIEKLVEKIRTTPANQHITTQDIATTTHQTLEAFERSYGDRYRSYSEQIS